MLYYILAYIILVEFKLGVNRMPVDKGSVTRVLKSEVFYLLELNSFQDAVKIARVVQFGHENVTIVITTLLSES